MQGFPRHLGKYVLVKPLARGGMGALYLALHGQAGMEKLCVVKTALPHLADRSYLQRFRDEAKIVVRLSHGNLVTVFDAGETKGEIFLAMEFIEGRDLRAVWNRCAQKGIAFPVAVAVHVARELVRGLAYAHSFEGLALVHRDVSPPNVLLSYSGEVKLTDFGLATSTLKLEKTAPGIIYGKVSYMSPEQARGEPLDRRTDLYAAGIILWELLTGRQLFPGGRGGAGAVDGEDDLLERVRDPRPVPPSQRAARVSPELDVICLKALSPDPVNRYGNGEEMRADLASFLARTAPATDGEQVAHFLRELFGEDIDRERVEREKVIAEARMLLRQPGQVTPRPAEPGVPSRTEKEHAPAGAAAEAAGGGAVKTGAEPHHTQRLGGEEVSRMVGSVLAERYHIKRLCGEGGMGRVYEAEHVEIGKRVALKVLHPAYTRTPDVVERFRREARAASKIYHPNIVNVTDSGTTADGSFFFVMEYIEGVELGFVIHKEGPLAPIRALQIAEQVCEALQAAHDVGVIHRDLKPENILLVTPSSLRATSGVRPGLEPRAQTPPSPLPVLQDVVKVLDFGIAKSADMEEDAAVGVGRRLTRPGVAMGTPEYMAPEQAAGKPADPRSDIYAVGSILYEMISGTPPYDGANVMEVLHKKANELPRPLRSLRPGLPASVEALVERAMARSPEARPQSMRDLAQEIRVVALALGTMEEVPAAAGRRRDSPMFAASIETPLGVPALRLSRRNLAAGAGLLVMLGAFVIVRAATAPSAPNPLPDPAPADRTVGGTTGRPNVGPARSSAPAPPVIVPSAAPAEAAPPPETGARPAGGPPRPGRSAPGGLTSAGARDLLKTAQTLLKAQRYQEASQAFKRLLPLRRERGMALVGLGNIAFQERNYADAVTRAHEAGKAGGGVAARLLLGDAYFKLQRFAEAKKAYDEAVRLDPASDTARRGQELAARRLN